MTPPCEICQKTTFLTQESAHRALILQYPDAHRALILQCPDLRLAASRTARDKLLSRSLWGCGVVKAWSGRRHRTTWSLKKPGGAGICSVTQAVVCRFSLGAVGGVCPANGLGILQRPVTCS